MLSVQLHPGVLMHFDVCSLILFILQYLFQEFSNKKLNNISRLQKHWYAIKVINYYTSEFKACIYKKFMVLLHL